VLKNLNNDGRSGKALAQKIAHGDHAAFACFVDKYGPKVQMLARRYAVNTTDSEDLIQEIFLALYKSIGSFRADSTLSTWVHSVALNLCRKHRERRPQANLSFDDTFLEPESNDSANPAVCAAQTELKESVQTALSDLTPEHRDVVILHELQELTYSECASILQIPVGTVKSRLYYAFRSLKHSLADYVLGEMTVGRMPNGVNASAETMI
jgi:RNA polymerase sigma-70 factor (ECF subfamily)